MALRARASLANLLAPFILQLNLLRLLLRRRDRDIVHVLREANLLELPSKGG